MGDTNGLGFELASIAAMEHEQRDRLGRQAMSAIRSIATIIGCPANTDPLTDLDGLVMMVRGLAERAETVRVVTADRDVLAAEVGARIADAVAAERHAIGAWLRERPGIAYLARSIEHGDHIDDDAPPLPSLRMVMLARDELLRQVETLTAERDRRIDPVEHAKAVMDGWSGWWVVNNGMPNNAQAVHRAWLESPERVTLLDRVGPDVLAEVER